MKKIELQIPEPCHENWQMMTPTERGRFCAACEKTVIDFSQMTDNEVVNYFKKPSQSPTCGRFAASQLNRPLRIATLLEKWYWHIETQYKEGFLKRTYLVLLGGALLLTGCEDPTRELIHQQEKLELKIKILEQKAELDKKQEDCYFLKIKTDMLESILANPKHQEELLLADTKLRKLSSEGSLITQCHTLLNHQPDSLQILREELQITKQNIIKSQNFNRWILKKMGLIKEKS